MRRRTITVPSAIVVAALALLAGAPASAGTTETERVSYLPPVDAPLADTFRPPSTPYGPGNRGIDYATSPGQEVSASAPGEVVFAGRVGGGLHVVIRHGDGIRSSYSFLGGVTVRRGDHVEQGEVLGTSAIDATPVHFGARAPTDDGRDAYLDPLVLLGHVPGDDEPHAHLVADPHPDRPLTEAEERSRLAEMLRGVGHDAGQAATFLRARAEATVEEKLELARILLDDVVDLGVPVPVYLVIATLRWQDEQATCTPAGSPVPPPPTERRIAILVGGLGSATGEAAILDTDTAALGYDRRDVVQFSYRLDADPYGPRDSEGDLDQAGRRLAAQIDAVARANPGVPVDVIAHSQGGLVARAAVVLHGARPVLLVTMGTPHHGADLATAGVGLDLTVSGSVVLDAVEPIAGLDLDERSIQQMSETSDFLRRLDGARLPATSTTTVLSIAVRGDPVVANPTSHLDHASNAVITTTGKLNEHDGLPGAPATTVELRRALAGQQPTCRTLVDALADEAIGRQTAQVHDTLGLGLTGGALYLDARTRRVARP